MPATDRAARALDERFTPIRNWPRTKPSKGWLRAIRDALGMNTRQFAARLGVSQPQVVAFERREVEETISLASLRKAASALGCELVYVLVPVKPLADILRERAEIVADEQLARLDRTMRLENQGLSSAELMKRRQLTVDELLRGHLRKLWDDVG